MASTASLDELRSDISSAREKHPNSYFVFGKPDVSKVQVEGPSSLVVVYFATPVRVLDIGTKNEVGRFFYNQAACVHGRMFDQINQMFDRAGSIVRDSNVAMGITEPYHAPHIDIKTIEAHMSTEPLLASKAPLLGMRSKVRPVKPLKRPTIETKISKAAEIADTLDGKDKKCRWRTGLAMVGGAAAVLGNLDKIIDVLRRWF